MSQPHQLALLSLALFLPACTSRTQPPQLFPGSEAVVPESLATVREADHIYVKMIDGNSAPEWNGDYRQYQVAAGPRQFIIYYKNGNSYGSPVGFIFRLRPGHTYTFKSNADQLYVSFGPLFSTGKWHPVMFDETTQSPPASQPTTTPAAH